MFVLSPSTAAKVVATGQAHDLTVTSMSTLLGTPARRCRMMSRDQARRVLRAVIDAIIVARTDGFDAALEDVGLDDDARQALTDVEHQALAAWHRDQLARVDHFLASFDEPDTVH